MKKHVLLALFLIFSFNPLFSQKIEKIAIPKGIIYKYCSSKIFEKSKSMIRENLSGNDYSLLGGVMFVGPVLWSRFQTLPSLSTIEGGNTTLLVDDKKLSAKLTQKEEDSKKVWNEFRKDIGGNEFMLRKATEKELQYYWSVISFDIEEPLIIVETKQANYILNINPKTMKLLWIDQAP